jgi:hypothetical protein
MYAAASPRPLEYNARPCSSSEAIYDSHSFRSSRLMEPMPPPVAAESVTTATNVAAKPVRARSNRRFMHTPSGP